jgi:hypothetical protein
VAKDKFHHAVKNAFEDYQLKLIVYDQDEEIIVKWLG